MYLFSTCRVIERTVESLRKFIRTTYNYGYVTIVIYKFDILWKITPAKIQHRTNSTLIKKLLILNFFR